MKPTELKLIITEVILQSLNETLCEVYGDDEWNYQNGVKWGIKDKLTNTQRELDKYPPAFVKGYKAVQREGWWQKFNDKLTNWLGQLGSSRLHQ